MFIFQCISHMLSNSPASRKGVYVTGILQVFSEGGACVALEGAPLLIFRALRRVHLSFRCAVPGET